jgi:hypothetical protein
MKKADFLLVTLSLAFSIYVAESILYITKIQPYTDFRLGSKGDQPFKDKRTKAKLIRDSRDQGIHMAPDIPPHTFIKSNGLSYNLDRVFPLAGIANRPTAYCNVYGERLVYQSDQYGFRNPNSIYLEEKIDVLIVGDSFSAGHCEKNDIGTLLRKKRLNTLNIAYGGNGPLIELAALREYGVGTKADVLLWIYFEGNDLKNLRQESDSSLLMNYLDPNFSQSLRSKQAAIDQILNQHADKQLNIQLKKESSKFDIKNLIQLKGLRFNIRRLKLRATRTFYPIEGFDAYLPLMSRVLDRAKKDVNAWGGEIVFVYLPQRERYGGPVNELRLYTYKSQILDIVGKLDIAVINFGDILDTSVDPRSYFPYGIKGHYNQKGYDRLAEQIDARLKQMNAFGHTK